MITMIKCFIFNTILLYINVCRLVGTNLMKIRSKIVQYAQREIKG